MKNYNDHIENMQLSIKEQIDNGSIEDMITLLKEYEKVCLDKQDFSSADEAKNKIDFLKTQKLVLRKEELENTDKENMQIVSKQGQEEIRVFQEHWEQKLQELIEALKDIENSLAQDHQCQLVKIQQKLDEQKPPLIKYSPQVLQMRKHLRNLIKVKNYKEAEIVKYKLENKEKEEQEKWEHKFSQKQNNKLLQFKKKQENQLKALRVRLQATFNEKLKQRDQKFQILLKKNRKRRIESGKVSRERLRARNALMNESKTMSVSKY